MKRLDDLVIERITKYGKGFIINLSILVKITGIYDSMNDAIVNTANRLIADLNALLGEEGEISLKMIEDSFFIEDTRIKATLLDLENFDSLIKEFKKRGIGLFTFKAPLSADDLINLSYALKSANELSLIQSALDSRAAKGILIGGPVFSLKEESIDLSDTRLIARRAYSKSLTAVKAIFNDLKQGKTPNIRSAKRAVHSLVDCIFKDEAYVLGLTKLRDVTEYIYIHSLNVAIFSMVAGKRLGFTKYSLGLLGMSALLHDAGTVEIPSEILQKPSEFSAAEMELVRRHPVDGVKAFLGSRGLNETTIISMLVSYEHHLNFDLSGYPQVADKRTTSIFSQIVRIADEFESLLSGRIFGRTAYASPDALKMILNKKDTEFNPTLVKGFSGVFAKNICYI